MFQLRVPFSVRDLQSIPRCKRQYLSDDEFRLVAVLNREAP